MAEYVDRKQLMKERERAIQVYENTNIFSVEAIRSGLKPLLDKIVDLHTADVVEVVRCVKCAFYDIEKYNCREFDCNMPCDGYCSKGTPKEKAIPNNKERKKT